jgi:hypothetical protein
MEANLEAALTACILVHRRLKSEQKTLAWFRAANPFLGNHTPKSMVLEGRAHRLLEFVTTQMDTKISKELIRRAISGAINSGADEDRRDVESEDRFY